MENENNATDFNTVGDESSHVRVRKRIRVKKKTSPKKKIRKFFERIIWTIVILTFFLTLLYLLKELDLSDKRYKKKAGLHLKLHIEPGVKSF